MLILGKNISQWFACGILFLMGWHQPREHVFKNLRETEKTQILLLQHTSYWDFALGVFYMMAQGLSSRVKYIMMDEIKVKLWYVAPIFTLTGCIFVPPIEVKNQGTTPKIIEAILADPTEGKIIMLAPNGSTHGSTQPIWRKGWYYIAKGINADIRTVGANYHPLVRCAQIGELLHSSEEEFEVMLPSLRLGVSSVYPKFPHETSVPLTYKYPSHTFLSAPKDETENEPRPLTPGIDLLLLLPILMNLAILWTSLTLQTLDVFLLVIITAVGSAKYHFSYEQDNVGAWVDLPIAAAGLIWCYQSITFTSSNLATSIMYVGSSAYFYIYGFPKRTTLYRPSNYPLQFLLWYSIWFINLWLYLKN